MKKLLLSAFLLLTTFSFTSAKEIKGDTLSFNGIKLIRLNGTHAERGYAYGRLLAKEIYEVYNGYFVKEALSDILPYYDNLLQSYITLAVVDARFKAEAEAILEGIKDSEYSDEFDAIWNRQFTVYDFLFANSIVELSSNLGCSAIMSWGQSTMQDPNLSGELVITRHLDWALAPELLKNYLIVVHNPSEPDEQKWVSFGFSALFGALSAVNESGVGVFQHMGNRNEYDMQSTYEPILLALRKSIELKDFNGDGKSRTDDVYDAINANNQGGAFIIDAVNSRANADSAIVIECTFDSKTTRSAGDHSQMPGTNLVATNHFRKLVAPEECFRYDKIQAALLLDSNLTIAKNWTVLCENGRIPNNLQVIQYVPSTKNFRTSFTDNQALGWSKEPFEFNFNDLFALTSIVERTGNTKMSKVSPNPSIEQTNLEFILDTPSDVIINITSSAGTVVSTYKLDNLQEGSHSQMINTSFLPVGGYFVKIQTKSGYSTNKIVVIR